VHVNDVTTVTAAQK